MAIANGTCVSFCNQPKTQFGYLRRVTPVCRCLHPFCGWRHLATSRDSKTHFGLPGYARGTIAVNVTWMERGFNACQMNRSIYRYPSIFNRFPVIQPVSSKVAILAHFLHILASLIGYATGTIAVNVTCMVRIQCLSNESQHVPIYLQPFPTNSTRKFKSSPF